jgi:hypothetical protein
MVGGARVDVHVHNSGVACLEVSDPATASAACMVPHIFSTINSLTLQFVAPSVLSTILRLVFVFLFRNICFSINPPIWWANFDHAKNLT